MIFNFNWKVSHLFLALSAKWYRDTSHRCYICGKTTERDSIESNRNCYWTRETADRDPSGIYGEKVQVHTCNGWRFRIGYNICL